jgi:hypothetical protein
MNTEDKTKLLNTLGYGLKYTLAIAIAILAICATCFIYSSISTYFAPPLQPMFDQERLGQLGDFLGGTLNPIFGFATVCLLLWSVFLQRKELINAILELKKSGEALSGQLSQSKNESARTQLTDLLKSELYDLDKLFSDSLGETQEQKKSGLYSIYGHVSLIEFANNSQDDKESEELNQLYNNHDPVKIHEIPADIYFGTIWIRLFNTNTSINRIIGITEDLLTVCHVEQIEKYWASRILSIATQCRQAGAISQDEEMEFQRRIQTARKLNKHC